MAALSVFFIQCALTKVLSADHLIDLDLEALLETKVFEVNPMGNIHHMHRKGEWMIGTSWMFMQMEGNRDKTSRKSTSDVLKDFMVSPTEMSMSMQMGGIMYGVTDEFTVMGMLGYLRKEMDHVTRMGVEFTTRSKGVGDLKTTGMYGIYDREGHSVHVTGGMSFPTGSINERDETPMGRVRLPYPMQLGSGTYDLLGGVTYHGEKEKLTWGGASGRRVASG
ncbi:MAG: hypothetical protein IID32_01175 [Planctomycetes bacterium]|nr:hypothetical protein [Planctomycetota bacterium]